MTSLTHYKNCKKNRNYIKDGNSILSCPENCMNQKCTKHRGSLTVEASVVLPMILMLAAVMVYSFCLLYQKISLGLVADSIVESAAFTYNHSTKDIAVYGLYKLQDSKGNMLFVDSIKKQLELSLRRKDIQKPYSRKIEVLLEDYLIFRKVKVKVYEDYALPWKSFNGIPGLKGKLSFLSETSAILNNSPDFIRNVDFAVDTEKMLEEKFKGFRDIMEELRNKAGGINESIEKYFK